MTDQANGYISSAPRDAVIQIRGWRFDSICFSAYYAHNNFDWVTHHDIWTGRLHWVGLISAQVVPTSNCNGWGRRLVVVTNTVTRYIDFYLNSTISMIQPVEIRILNANGVGINPDFYVPTVPVPPPPPPTKYACLNGSCILDHRGAFDSLAACQAVCKSLDGRPCNCPPPSTCCPPDSECVKKIDIEINRNLIDEITKYIES